MKRSIPTILFLCTEDWFFHSHFLPLARAAREIEGTRVVLATTLNEGQADKIRGIEKLGVEVIALDYERASLNPVSVLKLVFRLRRLMRRLRPDLVHAISLKPIVAGSLAALLAGQKQMAYHLTGQGLSSVTKNRLVRLIREMSFRFLVWRLQAPHSRLLVENPDDVSRLEQYGRLTKERIIILGGAGVDPQEYPARPLPDNDPPRVAFVGRLIWSKGLEVLVQAMAILEKRNIAVHLDIYGDPDESNPQTLSAEQAAEWGRRGNVSWHGRSNDIAGVWRETDIAVIPSLGGEGMPRAMLEAASCARPLIVTDVPGCRHFVRDGIEGLVVPSGDPEALAGAIAKLTGDGKMRNNMGRAARQRVLNGFTEQHFMETVAETYRTFLNAQRK